MKLSSVFALYFIKYQFIKNFCVFVFFTLTIKKYIIYNKTQRGFYLLARGISRKEELMNKEKENIKALIDEIDDVWILRQIERFILNIKS